MNFTTDYALPFPLGGTLQEAVESCVDCQQPAEDELEAWIDIPNRDNDEEYSLVVCRIEDNKCVTVALTDIYRDTFLGICLDPRKITDEEVVAELEKQGINVLVQFGEIILPEHLITIILNETITWWDPEYWGEDGFRHETIAP
ncbi:hypothetical protein [Corynebacterium epidermidicanis]|uniref:Uncharacterized protein n=1 Tax=Corynebacterium epidermidicanis TaxID=1050174 RepID=A0A0G3GTS8_9CORY|nr:hypothetical protein [Corynebacterium epidermidicanis]AKK03955.1 hypothetical protein CEPID_10630 [Corynebacterium epidermidicanis]